MDLLPVETTLHDLEGGAHRYETVPLPFDAAFDLGLELAALVGGPLGDALKGLLMGSGLDDAQLDEQVVGQAVAALGELPARLLQAGGSQLVARVLSTTTRIDKRSLKPGAQPTTIKQQLGDAEARTAAFAGGNLREAVDAIRFVLEVNFGPFIRALWEDLRGPLLELASSVVQPHESEATEPTTSSVESDSAKPTEIAFSST